MHKTSILLTSFLLFSSPVVFASGGGGGSAGSVPGAIGGGAPAPVYSGAKRISEMGLTKGQNLTISSGETVIFDQSVELGILKIESSNQQAAAECPASTDKNFNTLNPIVVSVEGVMVSGSRAIFRCGTSSAPYAGAGYHIEILNGKSVGDMGPMTVAAMNGGTIELHGQAMDKWLNLSKNAAAGSTSIGVENGVNWNIGDEIIIATTSFDPKESEIRVIKNITDSGRTIELDRALTYSHHGTVQTFNGLPAGVPRELDLRAEVANLSRNIKIYSRVNGSVGSLDHRGGHMMAMKMGGAAGRAYVDNVEFRHMGRMGELGRYSFHWHLIGNASGQYIRNSSIRDSFQRCVVIHETNNASVENNVCYNHFGHGIFMEEGNEENNTIKGNLVISSKKVLANREILQSELLIPSLFSRFSAPASYWISNPVNTVEDNVAVGSEGTGFWNSFSRKKKIHLKNSSATAFNRNEARANAVGINWDGAEDGELRGNPRNPDKDREIVISPYEPSSRNPVFKGLVATKNHFSGIYFRGHTVTFKDTVVADNGFSIWFALNQVLEDSLIVGRSESVKDADYSFIDGLARGPKLRQVGIRIYDGPMNIKNVAFVDFPNTVRGKYSPVPFGQVTGAERHYNFSEGLSFIPNNPEKKVLFPVIADQYIPNVESVYDQDGSLGGLAGRVILNDHPLMWDGGSCTRDALNLSRAIICDYRFGFLHFQGKSFNESDPVIEYSLTRISSTGSEVVRADTRPGEGIKNVFIKKHVPLIMDKGYRYKIDFKGDVRFGDFDVMFSTIAKSGFSNKSPVVKVTDSTGESRCFTIEANGTVLGHYSSLVGVQQNWTGFPGNNASCNF